MKKNVCFSCYQRSCDRYSSGNYKEGRKCWSRIVHPLYVYSNQLFRSSIFSITVFSQPLPLSPLSRSWLTVQNNPYRLPLCGSWLNHLRLHCPFIPDIPATPLLIHLELHLHVSVHVSHICSSLIPSLLMFCPLTIACWIYNKLPRVLHISNAPMFLL